MVGPPLRVPRWPAAAPEGPDFAAIRAEFHEPPDLDKLCELLIRLALQQSGSCRSEGATRPKRPRATANTSS